MWTLHRLISKQLHTDIPINYNWLKHSSLNRSPCVWGNVSYWSNVTPVWGLTLQGLSHRCLFPKSLCFEMSFKRNVTWNLWKNASGHNTRYIGLINPSFPISGTAIEPANQYRVMKGMFLNQSPISDILPYDLTPRKWSVCSPPMRVWG